MNVLINNNFTTMKQIFMFGIFVFSVAQIQAAEPVLTSKLLDKWLVTTQAFYKIESINKAFNQNKTFEKTYSSAEFKAMSLAKQNETIDKMLRDEKLYKDVYPLIKEHKWDNAGNYIRTSERMGKAMASHIQKMMAAYMSPEQAKMVMEASGGKADLKSTPEDVAFVRKNWDKISAFMTRNLGQNK